VLLSASLPWAAMASAAPLLRKGARAKAMSALFHISFAAVP
jgi:hypothetical protein